MTATLPGTTAAAAPASAGRSRGAAQARHASARRGRILRLAAAIVVSAVLLFPLYWMVVVALSSRTELLGGSLRLIPRSLTLDNFHRVFGSVPVTTWLGNSVAIALVTSVITVL
ncbi:MAG: hypothetical protein ABI181_08495, partial [Mycobacteriaceae bacterium]